MSNDKQPPRSEDARQAQRTARRRRRRRQRILRICVLLSALLVFALIVAFIVLRITGTVAKNNGEKTSFLAVRDIIVEGDTRYSTDEIIRESGIYVGESLLVVNKVQAHDRLLEKFPYLDRVEVGNASFSTIQIRVWETQVIGAVQTEDGYYVLGANDHALELLPGTALPAGCTRILGASLEGKQIGGRLLDARSLRIASALIEAADNTGLTDLTVIDMTEKTNIRAVWRDQICLVLGNETNLSGQIDAFGSLLPTLLQNNGEHVIGRLDMTSYADDDPDNDRAIFSPADALPETYAPPKDTPATDPTTAPATDPTATDPSAAPTTTASQPQP